MAEVERVHVAVIGAGVAGLCAAIAAHRHGVPASHILVLDSAHAARAATPTIPPSTLSKKALGELGVVAVDSGTDVRRRLVRIAEQRGIRIRSGTKVTSIADCVERRNCGLHWDLGDGRTGYTDARAIVIATGGYAGNMSIVRAHPSGNCAQLSLRPHDSGAAVSFAMDVGARVVEVGRVHCRSALVAQTVPGRVLQVEEAEGPAIQIADAALARCAFVLDGGTRWVLVEQEEMDAGDIPEAALSLADLATGVAGKAAAAAGASHVGVFCTAACCATGGVDVDDKLQRVTSLLGYPMRRVFCAGSACAWHEKTPRCAGGSDAARGGVVAGRAASLLWEEGGVM